jgi:putative FmdB family regulatory protein
MPFYEYQCKNCSHEVEAMQKVSDPPLKKCPHCGKSQLVRLMSAPVFRLKGGGWYETDFKGDKDKQRNLADKPEADAPKDAKESDVKGEKPKDDAKASDTKTPDSAAAKESSGGKEKALEKPTDKPRAGASAPKPVAGRSAGRGNRKRTAKKVVKSKSRR